MKLLFVGDINLGEYYLSFGHGPGTYAGDNDVFQGVQDVFDSADLLVGNLEAAITNHDLDQTDPESMVLRVNPDTARQLQTAGFDVLQVANNHTVQHGDKGFEDTLQTLNDLGIEAVGLNNQKTLVIERDGQRFGFLAASDVPDNTDTVQLKYQRLDDEFIDFIESETATVDHMIVMLHWGLEASTSPLPYQVALAERLRQSGVRAIIGSHPHLFYKIDKSEQFVSAYSLGNFVFDLCWDDRMTQTGILELEFDEHSLSARVWPVTITKNGCLPVPAESPEEIQDSVNLYDLGPSMDKQPLRKVTYMLKNIARGNLPLKTRFLTSKITKLLT